MGFKGLIVLTGMWHYPLCKIVRLDGLGNRRGSLLDTGGALLQMEYN
jgi:hypothetical protein